MKGDHRPSRHRRSLGWCNFAPLGAPITDNELCPDNMIGIFLTSRLVEGGGGLPRSGRQRLCVEACASCRGGNVMPVHRSVQGSRRIWPVESGGSAKASL